MNLQESNNLEQRLESLRASNPVMPSDVERRIRERIAAETQRPVRIRRIPSFPPSAGGSAGQILGLLILIVVAGLFFTHSVVATLHADASTINATAPSGEDHCILQAAATASPAPTTPKLAITLAAKPRLKTPCLKKVP